MDTRLIELHKSGNLFYHATFSDVLSSIKEQGITASGIKTWPRVSASGFVYITSMPSAAYAFIDPAMHSDLYTTIHPNAEPVLLIIAGMEIDMTQLRVDKRPYKFLGSQVSFMYSDTIPFSTVVEVIIGAETIKKYCSQDFDSL